MRRRERREPARRLLELARSRDRPAPPGLVPRDRDVDEPLVEVALRGGRGPPDELQLLVRLEVAARPGSARGPRRVRPRLERSRIQGYPAAVATILLCGVDLFFRGKLEALLPEHHLITVDHTETPDLVIADISRVDAEEVADTYPDVPILGYTNHTDTAGLRAAHAAGFDQVVVEIGARRALPELVAELRREELTVLRFSRRPR